MKEKFWEEGQWQRPEQRENAGVGQGNAGVGCAARGVWFVSKHGEMERQVPKAQIEC